MEEPVDLELNKEHVKKQACFSKLTDSEIETLAGLFKFTRFSVGETIVTEGDPVDSVYLILSGTADVRHVSIHDHKPVINSLATLGPGTAIGLNETGFYSLSGIRTATVVANTDMVTLCLSMAAFHGFALAYPHVNEVMHQNAKQYMNIDPQ
jgi:signal-transduction protein with cAMP-binding, CBS, and nucleotidyltransferase domain